MKKSFGDAWDGFVHVPFNDGPALLAAGRPDGRRAVGRSRRAACIPQARISPEARELWDSHGVAAAV